MTKRVSFLVSALIGLAGFSGYGFADAAESASHREAMDVSKEPYFAGIWVVKGSVVDVGVPAFNPFVGFLRRAHQGFLEPPAFKPEYAAKLQAAKEAEAKEDLGAACIPPGMPNLTSLTFAMEILQTPGQITELFEANSQVRRIFTDGRSHPSSDDWTPTYNGHSIGHWEGDTLVVDTAGIKTGINGMPFSDEMHVKERLRLADANTLENDVTVEDPPTLAKPWTGHWDYKRRPDTQMLEYVCEDNNRNTTDAKILPTKP